MIPASYLFRGLYHREFEQDPAEALAAAEARGGLPHSGPFERMLNALIGAISGSPSYTLGANAPECADRRR